MTAGEDLQVANGVLDAVRNAASLPALEAAAEAAAEAALEAATETMDAAAAPSPALPDEACSSNAAPADEAALDGPLDSDAEPPEALPEALPEAAWPRWLMLVCALAVIAARWGFGALSRRQYTAALGLVGVAAFLSLGAVRVEFDFEARAARNAVSGEALSEDPGGNTLDEAAAENSSPDLIDWAISLYMVLVLFFRLVLDLSPRHPVTLLGYFGALIAFAFYWKRNC